MIRIAGQTDAVPANEVQDKGTCEASDRLRTRNDDCIVRNAIEYDSAESSHERAEHKVQAQHGYEVSTAQGQRRELF